MRMSDCSSDVCSSDLSEGLLVEHLQATGHAVFPVSPRISARARERYKVAAVKDDRLDAFVLADTLRFDHAHWRPLSVPSPLLAEIKALRSDEHTSELQTLMRSSYAVFCLKKKTKTHHHST